ncbi:MULTISPECIES: ribonuclease R [unclassified Meiothermus]|uniref:ribonuclease R n=1 Tax=unclassified Meiothermus TaxID=370471 RepID=UPI000D7BB63E|nr:MULTISPECIES: ribonuclease R [unclassified Meiothermus]PZA07930.1 ribonuclease R [Meiothermus sp. Pnk-1]RYM36723.1 ribonuclease R [Meiothermus sp. PNK-Is4]
MTERILEYLRKNPAKTYSLREVQRMLRLERQEVKSALAELVKEGRLIEPRRGLYALPEAKPAGQKRRNGGFVGRLQVHPAGFGFVIPDALAPDQARLPSPEQRDLYIPKEFLGGAWHGDQVLAYPQPPGRDRRPWGRVAQVLERSRRKLTGRLEFRRGYAWVLPDDPRLPGKVKLEPEGLAGLEQGARIAVQLHYPEGRGGEVYGTFLEYLGLADDPGSETRAVIVNHDLKSEFDPETLAEAEAIPESIPPEELARRADFRSQDVFTIDGVDAKDFDDAIHVERLEGNRYRIGVHIADVSHYVREGSALDKEAYERGTSVYLPGRVLPMLPEKLSNGVCSLVPGQDRLVLSVLVEITDGGRVLRHSFREGVIRSKARLTYPQVQAFAEGRGMPEEFKWLEPDLALLLELTRKLKTKRVAAGALDFHFTEVKVDIGEAGEIHLIPQTEPDARSLIEELMLLANRIVAKHLSDKGLPALYRVHEDPTEMAYAKLAAQLSKLGYELPGMEPSPKAMQAILKQAEGKPEAPVVSTLLLRSLKLARYAHENLGHFGLAAEHYLHFTSPIRRYPDLVVHRVLKTLMRRRLTPEKVERWREVFPRMAEHTSSRERSAEAAERDLAKYYQCRWAELHRGEHFAGVVSGVTGFGVFVALENGVEGMIRPSSLLDDHYEYVEDTLSLVGTRTKRRIRIGDPLEVMIQRVDLPTRQIELVPAEFAELRPATTASSRTKEKNMEGTKKRRMVGPPEGRERRDRGPKVTMSRMYFGEWQKTEDETPPQNRHAGGRGGQPRHEARSSRKPQPQSGNPGERQGKTSRRRRNRWR